MSPVRTEYATAWAPPPFRPSTGRRRWIPRGSGVEDGGDPTLIGQIIVTVSPPGQLEEGQTVRLTAVRIGGGAPLTYAWAGPPGTTAPITSTSSSISWDAVVGDSGTYTVTVTSPGATDSPQSAGASITVVAPPGLTYGILMEDSGFILMEDSGNILLET